MVFALSGVHGAGKTTTLNALRSFPTLENFLFFSELTRNLYARGYDINENGGDETQLAVCNMHLSYLLHSFQQDVFLDRCLLDGLVYTQYLWGEGKVKEATFNFIKSIYEEHLLCYDKIFLFSPHSEVIEGDGVRSTSPSFHKAIQYLFEETIRDCPILKSLIIRVPPGSLMDRVSFIEEEYKAYGRL